MSLIKLAGQFSNGIAQLLDAHHVERLAHVVVGHFALLISNSRTFPQSSGSPNTGPNLAVNSKYGPAGCSLNLKAMRPLWPTIVASVSRLTTISVGILGITFNLPYQLSVE